MSFEYDPVKSKTNKDKHGIDFKEAQALWQDERLMEIQARNLGEERVVIIGRIDGKHWSAVITRRDGNTRLISVRRARMKEIEWYESERF